MIQLKALTSSDELEDELKHLYFNSFPANERRDWHQFPELIKHSCFNLYKIYKNNVFAGMITIWRWTDFSFIEHFAIIESLRSKGIGEEVIKLIIKNITHPIVLEVEELTTESSKRRIDFYKRLGFYICPENYFQPPYHKDKEPVKMILMSYPTTLTPSKFKNIKTKLYREVYQWNIVDFP